MSTDWREKEREFLAGLKADTGRDLAEWMALIAAQPLAHRNDIIDWLRRQGFMFSRASWLERIHHNGGQPIYLDPAALAGTAAREMAQPAEADGVSGTPAARPPEPVTQGPPAVPTSPAAPSKELDPPPPAAPVPVAGGAPVFIRPTLASAVAPPQSATPDAIAETMAKAKAYRPLAQFLLRSIEAALPGLTVSAGSSHLVLSRPLPFALLAISGKDIRLALALGARPLAAPFEPVRLPVPSARATAGLTHMLVLTDARQVDAALIALVGSAADCANP